MDEHRADAWLVASNCCNEVPYGVGVPPEEWSRWFHESHAELRILLLRWKNRLDE